MIYSGPGFLAVVRCGSWSPPPPLSRQQAVSLSLSSCRSLVEFTDRQERGREGGGLGAKSYDSADQLETGQSATNQPPFFKSMYYIIKNKTVCYLKSQMPFFSI
jgi:hypothetical protein